MALIEIKSIVGKVKAVRYYSWVGTPALYAIKSTIYANALGETIWYLVS